MPEHAASNDIGEGDEVATSPKDLLLFAARAARQNLVFCLLIAAAISIVGSTIVAAMPPVYDATCKIFIENAGTVTSTLVSGHDRNRAIEGARGLDEFLLARENLLSIVREAKLVDKWPSTRPLPMRIKDQIMAAVFGPPSRSDMERGFVEMLATSISGKKEDESVRLHAQWRDAQSAYDIARLVKRNFLAARAAHDLGPIQRAIPFLEAQLQDADQAIESAVSRVQMAANPAAAAGKPTDPSAKPAERTSAAGAAASELAAVSRQLAETRRQQRTLTDPWKRHISELKMQLVDMNASYSSDHPIVRQQEARIAAASEVPEELAALREKETELLSALSSLGGTRSGTAAPGAPEAARPQNAPDDSELTPLRARLFAALRKSDEISERLASARIELATAEADFKHRYVVVEEAEVPGKPLKAKKPLLFGVVLIVAMLAGILAGTALELRKGRLVEPWQVRSLGLRMLGEVDLNKLPPGKG